MKHLAFLFLFLMLAGLPDCWAQPAVITGQATDLATGSGLPNVAIRANGTNVVTYTKNDGTYTIHMPSGMDTLVMSRPGYVTRKVSVEGRMVVDVAMTEDPADLHDLVVTGYIPEIRTNIIGSVSIVNTEKMRMQSSASASGMIQGLATGITMAESGNMDGLAKLRIRGFTSFSNSDPLCIIDGIPGDIGKLNPADIESLQILKDAASTAIYGSRAANGVIVITTCKGMEGNVRVTLDAYTGIRYVNPHDFPAMANAREWGEIYFQSMLGAGRRPGDENFFHPQYGTDYNFVIPEYILVNDNGSRTGGAALETLKDSDPAAFSAAVDPSVYDYATHQIVKSADTDWFDEVFDPAPVTNVNLTASGGSERGTYLVSLNYYNTRAIEDVDHSYLTRYTMRTNTSFHIRNIINLGENLQVHYSEGRSIGSVAEAWTMPAILPVWDIAGNPAGSAAPGIVSVGEAGRNPVGESWHNRFDKDWTYNLSGNLFAEVSPVNNLVFRTTFGLDVSQTTSKDMTQVTYEHAENTSPPNSLQWHMSNPRSWTFGNTLVYSLSIGLHNARILLGTEAIDDHSIYINAARQNFLIDNNDDFLVIDAGTGLQSNSGSYDHSTLFSIFGQLDYNFSGKYLIKGTIRRDGSSKFGTNNRYGYFPSVAVGWRISDEHFMQGISWLSDLKLRGSFGVTGNLNGLSATNQYNTYVQDIVNSYPIQGGNTDIAQSYKIVHAGNPDSRWESTYTANAGFDATLFHGLLVVDFNYFIRESHDLLLQNTAPYTGANITQSFVNMGSIRNQGVELSAMHRGSIAGRIRYEITANFYKYRNTVLNILDNPETVISGGSTRMGNATLTKAGQPISAFYGYRITGFYNSQYEVNDYIFDDFNNPGGYYNNVIPAATGRWRLQDVNGDKVVNDHDRTVIGDPHPDFQLGMNIDLAYRGFDLTAFLFWNKGGDIFNYSRYRTDFNTFQYQRSDRMLYNSWTTELRNKALLPKLDLNDTYSNKYVTDYFVEDATYLRLKMLQLGYSFPPRVLDRIGLERFRMYASAQNLFTIASFSGLDPGISIQGSDTSMGISLGERPSPKQVLVGIQLAF